MTILDVINKTAPYFEKHGVDSPRLTIELLLAHLLQKKRLELYLAFEQELDDPTLAKLRELVRRRSAGEPLQYITGEAEFCGLKFAVDRRVLIPRPETELLVETVLARLQESHRCGTPSNTAGSEQSHRIGGAAADHQSPVTDHQSPLVIVDVGTGSGCIAVTMAKKLPGANVWAVDSSADALAVAAANAARHGVEKNIRFLPSDLLAVLPDSLQAAAVVANPPYVANGELAGLPKEVRDFEPVRALAAGEDGLDVIRRLVMDARRILSPTGFLALELGAGQQAAVAEFCRGHGWEVAQVVKDLQGHERVLVAQPGS